MGVTNLHMTPRVDGFDVTWSLSGTVAEFVLMWRKHGVVPWTAVGIPAGQRSYPVRGLDSAQLYDVALVPDPGRANGTVATLSPAPVPPPPPPPVPAPNARPGIAVGTIQNESASLIGQDLDAIKAAGAEWFRCDINWAQVQASGDTSFNWTSDGAIQAARARGLHALATIVYTPSWARPVGTTSLYPPTTADYAAFVKAAVAHYAPMGVQAYEIWNEPNASWTWTNPSPAQYAAVLIAAYAAAKQVDSSCTVISAGLSPAATTGGNYAPVDFLKGMYAAGVQGHMDAVGHHPYCQPALPGDVHDWSAWSQMADTPISLRSVMTANGDGAKRIWMTEFGGYTTGDGQAISQAVQATMVTKAFALARSFSWAGPLFVYKHRDSAAGQGRESGFGILNNDFSHKPAYGAYQQAAA